jgi:hypothetical protein
LGVNAEDGTVGSVENLAQIHIHGTNVRFLGGWLVCAVSGRFSFYCDLAPTKQRFGELFSFVSGVIKDKRTQNNERLQNVL